MPHLTHHKTQYLSLNRLDFSGNKHIRGKEHLGEDEPAENGFVLHARSKPVQLHSACLMDTKSSYSNHKLILIGLS